MTEKQNGFVFYVRVLAYTLAALALRAIALAPLACLLIFDDWKRLLALLCPVLAVLVILPLRCSFAQAMTRQPRRFCFRTAFSFAQYGEKLAQGLIHALHVLKWGVPFAGMLAGAAYACTQVDYLTLYQTIDEIGNVCGRLLTGTANNFMLGVGALLAVFGLGLLIWLWGAARNSASRYVWALKGRTGLRRAMKGLRLRQLGVALVNLLLWIPFLCVSAMALKTAFSDVSTLLMMAITNGSLLTSELTAAVGPVIGAFALLYLPLLPLRRCHTAAFVLRHKGAAADKKVQA